MTGKEKVIEILKQMDIYEPYIEGFKQKDKVCFFEEFAGFWIDQEPEAYKKMQEIEQKHGCKVYAVTHEYTEFGECWDYLSSRRIPKNGTTSFTKTEACSTRSPMYGTRTTSCAANSEASVSEASAAV